jgi:hypothetical protein
MSQNHDELGASAVYGVRPIGATMASAKKAVSRLLDKASGNTGDGGEIDGGVPALIPQGVYQLRFEGWSTVMLFGRSPKVVCWWSVVDCGEHNGARLPRWYNATRIIGQPIKNGRFKAGWSSELFREFATICGMPGRSDRIPLTRYSTIIVEGAVETVSQDRAQQEIPEALRYSVVRKLLRKAA